MGQGFARHEAPLALRRRLPRRALVAGAVVSALVVGSVGPIFAPVGAQDEPAAFPTAAVAPDDALAYFNIPLDEDSEQWAVAEDLLVRSGLSQILNEARSGMEGVPLDVFLGGEAGLIVTEAALEAAAAAGAEATTGGLIPEPDASPEPVAAAPGAQGWAVVLDPRAPDTAYAGLIAALEDDSGEVVEVDYEGVTISYAEPGPAPDEADMPLAAARVDDLLLIAGSPVDLEPLIDTAQGSNAALAASAPFADVTAALPDEFLILGFINEAAAADAQTSLGDLPVPASLAGSDRHSGFVIQADRPGFRMETVAIGAAAPIEPGAAPFESALLTRTPADALFFLSASDLGQTGVLQTLGAAAIALAFGQFGASSAPAGETGEAFVDRQYEELAALLGFNLKTDLLDQLVGEYGAWIRANVEAGAVEALLVSGVADPGTVVNALSQLSLLVQGGGGGASTVTTRTVGGSTVNVVETGPGAPGVEYGVVDGRLLIGIGGAIDTDAAGAAESLADNPLFDAVMEELREERNGTLYVDLSQVIPLVESLAGATGEMGIGDEAAGIADAAEGCADYATQDEAQAAYDANEDGTFDLDRDFDGTVCEDFFGDAATTDAGSEVDPAEVLADVDLSGVEAFALAAYDEDGMRRSSSILYIAE